MEQVDPLRRESLFRHPPQLRWRFVSIFLSIVLVVLLLTVFRTNIRHLDPFSMLLFAVVSALCLVIFLHTRFLIQARAEHQESEGRFQQMASNIQEIFWMIDAESKKALYVNDAYEAITGRSRKMLEENPNSYIDVIHQEEPPVGLGQA